MYKWLLTLLIVFISIFYLIGSTSAKEANGRYIVIFNEKVDKQLIRTVKGKVDREFDMVPALSISIPEKALSGLKKNPNVVAIEEDLIVSSKGQVVDWGMSNTNVQIMWESGYTGKNVKVAVFDTGIALNHEDLILAGGVSFVSSSTTYDDDQGHGTHVAGIIAAQDNSKGIIGVAPDVDLYAVKVLDQNGQGFLSDIIAGMEWAIMNDIDIMNFSLGMPERSILFEEIIKKAYDTQILMVAAAGNSGDRFGRGDTVEYPAGYEEVIAVAATEKNNRRAIFSATGEAIELSAPGVGIYSTYLNGSYSYMDGTSMAAPFVVGHLALLMEAYPCLSATELREIIQVNALDLGTVGRDPQYGFGLVQAKTMPITCEPIVSDAISFEDKNLEVVIREHLNIPTGPIVEEDLIQLTHLDASNRSIHDISPLSLSRNLVMLNLDENEIVDISPLINHQNLDILNLRGNPLDKGAAIIIRHLKSLGSNVNFDSFIPYPKDGYRDYGSVIINEVNKKWTVTLTDQADILTVEDHIHILNSLGERIEIIIESRDDKIFILSPKLPYEKNLFYYLYIEDKIISTRGNNLKESVQMKFYIE